MKKSKLLIAVSTFNQADFFLPRCLGCIQSQEFEDYVCIVGDDQSEDNTEQVVNDMKDERFVYYRTPSKYFYNSIFYNEAARIGKEAGAIYFKTCDGDNFLLDDHLQKHMDYMASADFEVIYSYARNCIWDDNHTIVDQYGRGMPWNLNSYIYGTSYNNFIDMSDITFKINSFINCGGYIEGIGFQDYSIMVRLALMYDNRVGFIPEFLTQYNRLPGGMATTRDASLESHMNIFAK